MMQYILSIIKFVITNILNSNKSAPSLSQKKPVRTALIALLPVLIIYFAYLIDTTFQPDNRQLIEKEVARQGYVPLRPQLATSLTGFPITLRYTDNDKKQIANVTKTCSNPEPLFEIEEIESVTITINRPRSISSFLPLAQKFVSIGSDKENRSIVLKNVVTRKIPDEQLLALFQKYAESDCNKTISKLVLKGEKVCIEAESIVANINLIENESVLDSSSKNVTLGIKINNYCFAPPIEEETETDSNIQTVNLQTVF